MTDFAYDTYDVSTLKVAFENYRKAEQRGFWFGVLLGFPLGTFLVTRPFLQAKLNAGPVTKVFSSLLWGSLVYSATIFNARQSYNDVASKINRKYSILLNKAITYH